MGLYLLLLVTAAIGKDQIFIRDSYCYSGTDSVLITELQLRSPYYVNTIGVGLSCPKPLAALQFCITPVNQGIHLLPGLHLIDCQDWYYEALNTPNGGLKVIILDTLLRGNPINPNGYDYSSYYIECLVDSSPPNGIFPIRITEVQAYDTAGKEIQLAQQEGQLITMNTEALLAAFPDTISTKAGSYTYKLYETNFYPVGYIRFLIKVPYTAFKLEQVNISYPHWAQRWSQDSTGIIDCSAWVTDSLLQRPCLGEKELMDIALTFSIDSSLAPGVYQFEPHEMIVLDCTDNFNLSTAMAVAPLVIQEPVTITPRAPASALTWRLGPSYPNPFNLKATIQYTVATPGEVEITVFDLTGHQIQQLVKKYHQPGAYRCEWTGQDQWGKTVASGIYLVRMLTSGRLCWHKMLLIK